MIIKGEICMLKKFLSIILIFIIIMFTIYSSSYGAIQPVTKESLEQAFQDLMSSEALEGINLDITNIQVENEIAVMLQGKKMEQKVMTIMPLVILIYVDISASEMIASLYTTILGRIVMTICLVVYLFSYWLGQYFVQKIESV